MNSRVAVVIPAFDAARWIGEALSSLKQQTRPPHEVVVVDDGSKDDTARIAEANGALVVRQQQKGPAAARNRGVAATTSPRIAFLDADDWFLPTKLERQGTVLDAGEVDSVACDAWLVENGERKGRKNATRAVPERVSFDHLLEDNPLICSSVLVRREAFVRAGGFDEDPVLVATEDYDLWLRIARHGAFAYLPEPMCCYRRHGVSLSANTRFLRGVDRILDKVEAAQALTPNQLRLVRARRAGVRLDRAYDLVCEGGKGAEARALIREAQRLSFTWKGLRTWLRSFVPPRAGR